MRIFYLGNVASIHVRRWVRYFSDKGHEVHLVSKRTSGEYHLAGITMHPIIATKPHIGIVSNVVDLLVMGAIQLKKLVRKLQPDILHAHNVSLRSMMGAIIGFHPYLVTVWGSDVLTTPRKSIVHKILARFILTKADVILTTSQYLKKYLCAEFNIPEAKIVSLPWGVDLSTFAKGYKAEVTKLRTNLEIHDDSFVILSPRHLTEHYRIDNIIRSMPYVIAMHPNVSLIVLKGASEDIQSENQADRLIKQLGIEGSVQLIRRHLSSKEMAVLYNACDAFISIPKTDGFASCILEGMACGTMPIVADLEVYRQYLNDGSNALFVNPDDAEDIAAKITFCIEHPELKQSFYKINKRIIEQNEDWAQNAAKLEDLYHNLLNRNRHTHKQIPQL